VAKAKAPNSTPLFPLIQLPRKSEGEKISSYRVPRVSINSTSEEVRSPEALLLSQHYRWFPLIQLPRKSEASSNYPEALILSQQVSINSTSEEVRSFNNSIPIYTASLEGFH